MRVGHNVWGMVCGHGLWAWFVGMVCGQDVGQDAGHGVVHGVGHGVGFDAGHGVWACVGHDCLNGRQRSYPGGRLDLSSVSWPQFAYWHEALTNYITVL